MKHDHFPWNEIMLGMAADRIKEILGHPDRKKSTEWFWVYHPFSFASTPHKAFFGYELWLDSNGLLVHKQSPFLDSSIDGKPTCPRLITPSDQSEFYHYPRIMDIRWQPCDGVFPIRYDLKLSIAESESGPFGELNRFTDIEQPYFCLLFVGDQPGQISIRSHNSIGSSDWSKPVTFFWYPEYWSPPEE